MCNLYNLTTTQEAIRQLARALRDIAGNLQPSLELRPNYLAPVVRNAEDGVRELARLTWGLPSPDVHVAGKNYDRGVTNIRKTFSPHWRQWLGVEHRCVVPVTSFAEPAPERDPVTGKIPDVWFALNDDQPLFFFPGIWTRWSGTRKVKDGPSDFELYAFLTTSPNGIVGPIHPKAMPVILTTPDEIETWLTAPAMDALRLQRPLPDDMLRIVSAPPAPAIEPVRGTSGGDAPSDQLLLF